MISKTTYAGCSRLEFWLIQRRLYAEALHVRNYRGVGSKDMSGVFHKILFNKYKKKIYGLLTLFNPPVKLVDMHLKDTYECDLDWPEMAEYVAVHNIDYYEDEEVRLPYENMTVYEVQILHPPDVNAGVWTSKEEYSGRWHRRTTVEYYRFTDGTEYHWEDGQGYATYLKLNT